MINHVAQYRDFLWAFPDGIKKIVVGRRVCDGKKGFNFIIQ